MVCKSPISNLSCHCLDADRLWLDFQLNNIVSCKTEVLPVTAMLLAYAAAAYSFSGMICYLAYRKDFQQMKPSELRGNRTGFTGPGITLLWPFWLISKIYRSGNKTSKSAATLPGSVKSGSSDSFWMP